MPPVGLMIKPASGRCNLRCRYCFYRDETEHRCEADYGVMSEATLDSLLKRVFAHAQGEVSVVFQGASPPLPACSFTTPIFALLKSITKKTCLCTTASRPTAC